MPIIGLVVAVALSIVLDVAAGPGFGELNFIAFLVSWPTLAPFDFGKIVVPWLVLHWFYGLWTLILFVAVSVSGDAWPFGR